ncbi:hypothetical protein FOZ63_029043 [Perkinsus olseni]|uniref:Uncharacterized protein n=1 Tax=Perkinsus olseni TaxID=32597 RepID=A0A7J6QG49_PEROL|nr:hypothetical protein FOZ63_029043 [Perkinsus olseni]
MINFVSTLLFPAQLLVITTAQEVGRFVHVTGAHKMIFDVNAEGEAKLTFTSLFPPPPGSPEGTLSRYWGNFFGPYSLSKVQPSRECYLQLEDSTHTYTFDLGNNSRISYLTIAAHLKQAGVADEPLAGIQPDDLTTLTYTSNDVFTTEFRNETIEFMRVAESFTPGVFEYAESVAPYFKLTYLIRADGIVGIQASCNRRRTSQVPFRLSRRDKGRPYLHYDLESAGRGTLDQLLYMVNIVCPRQCLRHGDLSPVVFATSDTIYVALGGSRLALTRTK